jgi:DNA-directed RNA polymerase subunit RPC12/RpoP
MSQFYRCMLCHSVIAPWQIKEGECPVCGNHKIKFSNVTLWEKITILIKNIHRIRKVPNKWEFEFHE